MTAFPPSFASDWTPFCSQGPYRWQKSGSRGYVRLVDMPDYEASKAIQGVEFGQDYIASYTNKKKSKFKRSLQRARYLKRHLSGNSVLDVGSNVGLFVAAAQKLGLDAEGLEISKTLFEYASSQYPEYRFHCSALEEFKASRRYDGIYCSEVIEHSSDVLSFGGKLFELLNPGGVLYLTTPSIDEYMVKGRVERDLGAPDHKFYFDHCNIDHFLKEVGFRAIHQKWTWVRKGIQVLAYK